MANFIAETARMDGGIDNDIRSTELGKSRFVQNFDLLTYPRRLVPYRSSEAGDSGNNNLANFLYANSLLYGLGVVSGTGRPQVYSKSDFTNAVWGTITNSQGSLGRVVDLFVYYMYGGNGYIFGAQGTGNFWKMRADGSSFTDADASISFTTVGQGLVHSKDDTLYVPYDNKIAKNLAGSWSSAVLTIPADYFIPSICEYGNYLAVAGAPLGSAGRQTSKAFLWDRDTTLATLPEVIDFGAGYLYILEELEGSLISISIESNNALKPKLLIKEYTSKGAEQVIRLDATAISLGKAKQKTNNSLYFMATITFDGTVYRGVWRFGRNREGHWALSFDRTPNNDTTVASIGTGFYLTGDYMFVTYNDGAGNDTASKTNDSAVYVATAIEESVINPDMKDEYKLLNKQLLGIGISFAPLTSGQQVVLKYKIDGGAWTTIFTETTVGQTVTERTFDAANSRFTAGREYQYRVESTGGAEITGRRCKYGILETNI